MTERNEQRKIRGAQIWRELIKYGIRLSADSFVTKLMNTPRPLQTAN